MEERCTLWHLTQENGIFFFCIMFGSSLEINIVVSCEFIYIVLYRPVAKW
jgi:hypothetical protein